MLSLKSEHLHLEIAPELGAGITAFRYRLADRFVDIMRPSTQAQREHVLSPSDTNFILAPYSNRIRDGRFVFAGERYQLAQASKHAIHGDLRNQSFTVSESSASSAILKFASNEVEDFNYPFELGFEVEYHLQEAELTARIHIENQDSCLVPVGGGFHPYFSRSLSGSDEEVELRFKADGVYYYGDGEPIAQEAAQELSEYFDFSTRAALREGIDHCYADWHGQVQCIWPKSKVAMLLEAPAPLRHLVLYTPRGERYFAVEPVSNATDAFNLAAQGVRGVGMMVLEPEARCTLEMRIRLSTTV